MVSQVNYGYYQDPMVYAQHLAVPQHEDNLMSDVKGSLTVAPLIAIPSAIGAKNSFYAAVDGLKHNTSLKNIPSAFTNGMSHAYRNVTGGNFADTFQSAKNVFKNHDAIQAAMDIQDLAKTAAKAGDVAKATELGKMADDLMKAAKNGDDITKLVSKADDVINATKAASKPGLISKITSPIKKGASKITKEFGETAAGKVVQEGAEKTGFGKVLGKFGKLAKRGGAVFDAVIEGGMALFTEVIPAFKNGGFKSGMKQIGKSTVQVAGSVGGWVAGAKGGAAIGAAIGSIFPGAGTAIGGAIGGIVGGLLGSSLLSGIAKKITGKNESEKIAEQQAQQEAVAQTQIQPQQFATNPYGGYDFSVPTNLYPQFATTSYLA